MAVPNIPNPRNRKGIEVVDLDGGAPYFIPVTIAASNQIDTGDALAVGGLQETTAGVTDTTDKRFVTDAELADLVTLQPLAALEAVLAALGARTGAETLLASATSVNLNTATPPTLYTVATGKSAVITRLVVRLVSHTLDTVSFSVGFNSTAFDNILADATHTELTGNTLFTVLAAKAGATIGTTGQALKLKNNTLNGTATTCTIDVFGYLF